MIWQLSYMKHAQWNTVTLDFYSGNVQAFPGLRPVGFILRVFSTGSLEYKVKNTLVVLLSLDSVRPFRLDQPV